MPYDNWYTLPIRYNPIRHTLEHFAKYPANLLMPNKKRRTGGYLKGTTWSLPNISASAAATNIPKAAVCANPAMKKAKKKDLGDDGGTVTTCDSIRVVEKGMEYEIHPKGQKFTKTYTDSRSLYKQLAVPCYQTYAATEASTLAMANPNQAVHTWTFCAVSDMRAISQLLNAHYSATQAQYAAGGPGGLARQLIAPSVNEHVDTNYMCFKFLQKNSLRNYTNTTAKVVIEEWLCKRDCDNTSTPDTLYGHELTYIQDNNATVDAAVAAITWRTGGVTTCRVATLADPGERIHGSTVNTMWKKIKTTSLSIPPGRTISYTMSQPPFSVRRSLLATWNEEATTFAAGMSRAVYVYHVGEMCGNGGGLIAPASNQMAYKQESFMAYANNIDNAKRRDITYAGTNIYPTVADANQDTTNEETEAGNAGTTYAN